MELYGVVRILLFLRLLGASTGAPPVIEAQPDYYGKSLVNFRNATHIVVRNNTMDVRLRCNASYPVMWSLDSLDQSWVFQTSSNRWVTDYFDKSTYIFSMTVTVQNWEYRPDSSDRQISLEPQQYVCQAVDSASGNRTAKITVIWEAEASKWPYWGVHQHKCTRGSYQVHWDSQIGSEILIPCYTLNIDQVSVSLFNTTTGVQEFYGADNGTTSSMFIRFENYVGFFINSTIVGKEEATFQCVASQLSPGLHQVNREGCMGDRINFNLVNSGTLHQDTDPVDLDRDRATSNLVMNYTDGGNITCCIRNGFDGSFTADNMVIYDQDCYDPLRCLTGTNMLQKRYIYSAESGLFDVELSERCRTIHPKSYGYSPRPIVHVCHMRTDTKFQRTDYVTPGRSHVYYRPLLHQNQSENTYLLHTDAAPAYALLRYYKSHREYLNDISDERFFDGQGARFRCSGSRFYYAEPVLWELTWQNGSSTVDYSLSEVRYDQTDYVGDLLIQIKVRKGLQKISCHVPLWNSTGWTTRSLSFTRNIKEAPRSPWAVGGRELVTRVEFVAGKSAELVCDFNGIPTPSFSWSIATCAYDFHEGNQTVNRGTKCGSQPQQYNVYETRARKLTVSLLPSRTFHEHLEESFSCTATNFAGSSTRRFRVQAIAIPPKLKAVETNRVLFLNDKHVRINCSVAVGLPHPEIRWLKDGKNISQRTDQYTFETVGNASVLSFTTIEWETEGEYTCVASNIAGRHSKSIKIRVVDRPPGPWQWPVIPILALAVVVMALIGAVAHFCLVKAKEVDAMKLRVEYTNASEGGSEPHVTMPNPID